jgi:thiamine biosynthesis protein ThiI
VSLEHPEVTIHVEVLPRDIYFAFGRETGPGGLPVGVSGNVVALLSGGIDSPVAAHRLMKRGCRAVFVHFHSHPFQDATSRTKAADLVRCLTRFQFHSRLYLAPFGEVQRQIVAAAPAPLRVVLYRRFMARIAAEIARREGAKALVTGEVWAGRVPDAGQFSGHRGGRRHRSCGHHRQRQRGDRQARR